MEFNVNENVRVKLTDFGISILKKRHDELNEMVKNNGGVGFGEFELRLDEEGYYKSQLWSLMSVFGEYMTMGMEVPFETTIIIDNAWR